MSKETIIRKLTSRKLWLAIALFVSGLLTALGNADKAETISGLIMQAAAVIGYLLAEGLTDAANKPPDSDAVGNVASDAPVAYNYYYMTKEQADKGVEEADLAAEECGWMEEG